jgi:geranylgeranyl reductase family protein
VHDAVVIGAGPSGSITAARLAEQGRDVVLVEEHPDVGFPTHCTGLLGVESFKEFDLPFDLILGEARTARFYGAAGQSVSVESEQVRAAVIDRAALDRHLASRAREAGVDMRTGWRAEAIVVGPQGVSVRGRDGAEILARVCVLACGADYRFHRRLGLGLPAVFLQSAQLETPFPGLPDDEVEVRFGREIAPSGFAWVVQFERERMPHARIGLMSETRSRVRFEAFLRSICGRAGVDRAGLPQPRLKILPLGPVGKTHGDRIVAVGDAAGLVKPTTGGGIYYGLLSGAIAADILDEGLSRNRLDAAFLRRYETAWRRRFGQEIRVALAFRRMAARLNDNSIDALIELARINGIVPLLQRKTSFNWHRKAAVALMAHPSFHRIVRGGLGG